MNFETYRNFFLYKERNKNSFIIVEVSDKKFNKHSVEADKFMFKLYADGANRLKCFSKNEALLKFDIQYGENCNLFYLANRVKCGWKQVYKIKSLNSFFTSF